MWLPSLVPPGPYFVWRVPHANVPLNGFLAGEPTSLGGYQQSETGPLYRHLLGRDGECPSLPTERQELQVRGETPYPGSRGATRGVYGSDGCQGRCHHGRDVGIPCRSGGPSTTRTSEVPFSTIRSITGVHSDPLATSVVSHFSGLLPPKLLLLSDLLS